MSGVLYRLCRSGFALRRSVAPAAQTLSRVACIPSAEGWRSRRCLAILSGRPCPNSGSGGNSGTAVAAAAAMTSVVGIGAGVAMCAADGATEDAGDAARYLDAPLSPDLEERKTIANDWQARMEDMVLAKQAEIVNALSEVDGGKFRIDRHERPGGEGGGITAVIQDSTVFEKGGVNVSVIRGELKPRLAQAMSSRGKKLGPGPHRYFATGISSVLHPRNPLVPTMHFNYRYFECTASDGTRTWWYGGGTDLTPYRLFEDDVKHFHQTLKDGCDKHDPQFYPDFKKWCDEYFLIKHRNERRGVGGVFFDDLDNRPQEELFQFVSDMADTVLPCYMPMLLAHKDEPYDEKLREWQLLRRGRYVEYNLVYDRGTKFGLATPQARIESIFISLPLNARWEYKHTPEPDSPEAKLTEVLINPRDWVE